MRSVAYIRWFLLFSALSLAIMPGYGQAQSPELEITHLDVSEYPEVEAYVTNRAGQPLDPTTIEVIENGERLSAEHVDATSERVGVAVAIVIDTSRSMRGRGMPNSTNRLHDARDGAIAIAKALDIRTDLLTIYTFHREPTVITALEPADGGGVENQLLTDERVNTIPDKPGGPDTQPTEEDYRNDAYAYAALSEAVSTAVNALVNPTTEDDALRERLARMHKVVVVFSDSCDDALTALDSADCSIPADLQATLEDVAQDELLTIFGVGVGVNDPQLGLPTDKEQRERGFAYNAQHVLLERITDQVPHGRYLHLFAADENAAAQVQADFRTTIVSPTVERTQQVHILYRPPVVSGTVTHEVEIRSAGQSVNAIYEEPPIPPQVTLQETARPGDDEHPGRFPLIELNVDYAQTELVRAEYFVNDSADPIIVNTGDLSLDTEGYEPGTYTIQAHATDARGQQSELSPLLTIEIPPPSAQEVLALGLAYVAQHAISLSIGIILIISLTVFFVMRAGQRGRASTGEVFHVRSNSASERVTRFFSHSVTGARYALVVREGANVGKHYILSNSHMYIGADRGAVDIFLDDEFVSRQHASLQQEGSLLYIVDNDSSNGVFVNEQRIPTQERVPLPPQTLLRLGSTVLECILRVPPQSNGDAQANTELAANHHSRAPTVSYDQNRHDS